MCECPILFLVRAAILLNLVETVFVIFKQQQKIFYLYRSQEHLTVKIMWLVIVIVLFYDRLLFIYNQNAQ